MVIYMKLSIDRFKNDKIFEILKRINNNGFESFIVGGAVRDAILNKDISDFDITTDAKPEDIKNIFFDCKIKDYGSRYGTVGIIYGDSYVEITTYRKEKDYISNRKPNEIEFVSELYTDLSRRDFTINSLAYNPLYNNGEVIDYFNGINDLKNKIIRTINNPFDRFKEDGLRILRALRFSSTLGFEIEEKTFEAIEKNYMLALNTSIERRSIEINKLLFGNYFDKTIKNSNHILKPFLTIFNCENSIESYCKLYKKCDDIVEKLTLLYFNNQELLKSESLKLSINKNIVNMCIKMFTIISNVDFNDELDIRLKTNLYKKEDIIKAYKINNLILGNNINNDYLLNIFKNVCYFDDLNISKKEVINEIKRKKNIKYVLDEILKNVILGKVENDKNNILNYLQNELNIDKFN